MGKIFCLMGKSASGKDTLYNKLLEDASLGLKRIVPYTTRPKRAGEKDGEAYIFCSDEEAKAMEKSGRVIEMRAYNTVCGIWKYFTADDGQICPEKESCLLIGTLESYVSIKKYFGDDLVRPIYVQVEDGERLKRALLREMTQDEPRYAELCRRFLADEEDFSREKLEAAGVLKSFENADIDAAIEEIKTYIIKETAGSDRHGGL